METSEQTGKSATRNLYHWAETLIHSDLRWLGRLLLKLVRLSARHRPVEPGRAPKANPTPPAGPFETRQPRRADLLIFVPRGFDSRLIDDATGQYGYSHIAVDCGEVDLPTGKPVMIESMIEKLVKHEFLDLYGARPFVRIPLTLAGVDADAFCDCVKSKLGQAYDYLEALTWGEVDDPAKQICTDLASLCIPEWMRADIAAKHSTGQVARRAVSVHKDRSTHGLREFVSPNGFAEYFQAPKGMDLTGPDELALPEIEPLKPLTQIRRNAWKPLSLLAAALLLYWINQR